MQSGQIAVGQNYQLFFAQTGQFLVGQMVQFDDQTDQLFSLIISSKLEETAQIISTTYKSTNLPI